ncbi:MAG: ankyrin repeat domain-containing protein [Gemmatimonadetes bacterium]|nr:ankyrin repeat domain-containing protein [Gemmatimonadota bacterium]
MSDAVPVRRLPVRPDADHLRRQAKELLQALHAGDPAAVAELAARHPTPPAPHVAKLADAQLVLARSYQASSWPRLMQAVQLADAIWQDDLETVRSLITANAALLHEPVLVRESNWGPPMSYAANLGRDRIIRFLHQRGATDLEHAAGRAALQGHVGTARMLHDLAGQPPLTEDALGGPAYTLNVDGTALMLTLGAPVVDDQGACVAPVSVVLETDSRNPAAKHAILALYEQHGLRYPDTPVMALHRGRLDLLEAHLARDPALLSRTFTHREIYPSEMGCRDEIDATTGTPLGGSTLLHLCVDYDEYDIAEWLIARGADVNAPSRVGASGFGGHTPLFNTVVSQPNFWMNYGKRGPFTARFTDLLLAHGADPNVRASLWKRLHPGHGDPTRHDYRDVTALSWGQRFHAPIFVSQPAMERIAAAGGQP